MFARDHLQLQNANGEPSQKHNSRNDTNVCHLLVLRYPDGFLLKLSPQAARAIESLITGYSDQDFWIIARLVRIRYLNSSEANKPASPLLFFQAADELSQAKIISPLPRHLQRKRFSHPNPLGTLNQKGALD